MLTDDQTIDAAAMLMVDSRLTDNLLLREEIAGLRRDLSALNDLVAEWAQAQHPPANRKQGDDLMPWLNAERDLSIRLMRAGGVEPRIVPEGES